MFGPLPVRWRISARNDEGEIACHPGVQGPGTWPRGSCYRCGSSKVAVSVSNISSAVANGLVVSAPLATV